MSFFTQDHNGEKFHFPIFKFLRAEHAKALLSDGNVHLSRIAEFRDSTQHTGLILDNREGQVTLVHGVQQISASVNARNCTEISTDNIYLYCATKQFLSDSLKWAIDEGKEACVLIVDPDVFAEQISSTLTELHFVGAGNCIYIGREIDLTQKEVFEQIARNPYHSVSVKPVHYAAQREVRLAWEFKEPQPTYPPAINKNVANIGKLIPVHYSGMERLFSAPGVYQIGARMHWGDMKLARFQFEYPKTIMSPIIHYYQGRKMLGFLSPSSQLANGSMESGVIGAVMKNNLVIVCNVFVDDVHSIEYFVV